MKELDEDDLYLDEEKVDENPLENGKGEHNCVTSHTGKYWTIGAVVTIVVIISALVLAKTRGVNKVPNQNTPVAVGQQVAYSQANCAIGQYIPQYLPQGNTVAYVPPNCALGQNLQQGLAHGKAVAATIPPNCATCPSVAQCFPQGSAVAANVATVAPIIYRDALMPHEFRGVCSSCHQIKPDVAITANAPMLHEYRGVCSNCHVIQ